MFELKNEPEIQSSEPQGFNRVIWLEFSGAEAICLARFCFQNKDQHPVLVVECERGDDKGPHIYEGYNIDGLTQGEDRVSINGWIDKTLIQLHVYPNRISDDSGKVVTQIKTVPRCFPMGAYLRFRQTQLEQQSSSLRRFALRY